MSRRIRLTDAQVYTLRRMKSGTRYFLQGNGKRGDEDNGRRRVNCPSLPVLFREGLVDFCIDCKKQDYTWYSVKLTPDGTKAAIGAQTREERGL
ncbi:hypothetical protein FML15_22885 [Klebsiella michiganensis]|nr:hypothetical protein [Klebsiella michiganensis]